MKKGILLTFLMVFSLSAILAGCGGNNGNSKSGNSGNTGKSNTNQSAGENSGANSGEGTAEKLSGKVTFLTNRTDMIGKEYDEYVKRFNEKYPDIKIEFEASQTDYNQQIKVRMASGELPDLMFIPDIPNSDLPKYFASLDDLQFSSELTFKDFKSYDGKLYGITTGNSTSGIVYNKRRSPMPELRKSRKPGTISLPLARSSNKTASSRSLPTLRINGRSEAGYTICRASSRTTRISLTKESIWKLRSPWITATAKL